jgi:hypothetical protein
MAISGNMTHQYETSTGKVDLATSTRHHHPHNKYYLQDDNTLFIACNRFGSVD